MSSYPESTIEVSSSSSSLDPSAATTSAVILQPTPVYQFVKDILQQHQANGAKPLRDIAAQRWNTMSEKEKKFFEEVIRVKVGTSSSAFMAPPPSSNSSGSGSSFEHPTFEQDLQRMSVHFGSNPKAAVFTIASTNVFVHRRWLTIPAEVGLLTFSLEGGITKKYSELLKEDNIPIHLIIDAVRNYDHHSIPYDGIPGRRYPKVKQYLRAVHAMLHSYHGAVSWIFIEDDEFDQTTAVLEGFVAKSAKLQLNLNWNLNYFRLSRLVVYFKTVGSRKKAADGWIGLTENEHYLFKCSMYDYLELCPHHLAVDSPVCALSKAHRYAYLLSRYFSAQFGIVRKAGAHLPTSNYRNFY